MIKTVFFGSSEYSIIILKKLLELPDFEVSLIVSKIDKPVGRNQQITPNPIAAFAQKNKLPLLQIEEFSPEVKQKIKNLNLDLGLCVAFGPPYFDQEMIDIPKFKIINIHPSPLPKYRGATPGPWQIINNETNSSVTFFQIDHLPDHGPIITQIPFKISPNETATSFYQKAFKIASDNLNDVLKSYIKNPNCLKIQNHDQKTYFPRFTKESAQINWSWGSGKISRFVRALNPWPIAWTYITDQKGKQLKMKIFKFDSGSTQPIEVQIEGKTPTNWHQISSYYQIKK